MAGIGVLKSVKVAVFDMKCNDWYNDTITITWIQFLYNKEKRNEENILESITKIQNFLNVWQMSRLTLEGRIIVFITFAISKNFFLSLISKVPTEIFKWARKNTTLLCGLLNQRQKSNLTIRLYAWWSEKRWYTKNIISLQWSWVRKLYDHSFHEWKVISLKFKKNLLDHILNLTLIFNSISHVVMIFHLFAWISSVTGKSFSQPIQKLHRAYCLSISGLISW